MSAAAGPARRIAVFGLGKLGSVIAACWASRGFEVIGVDRDPAIVAAVGAGEPPVVETRLDEIFAEAGQRLCATTDGADAVRRSDMSFIVVPTPSHPDGSYSTDFALEACRTIGEALRDVDSYHVVVLKSTVLPGSCDERIVPELERASRKRCGRDFGFCYNPEFIALGSVVQNLMEPEFLLFGESDARAGDRLVEAHARMLCAPPPMPRMSIANAELAKISVNSFITMKITFANLVAQICEELPGGDARAVSDALGLDSRIGRKYLTGGLGFGGPCFPRDNAAMLFLARQLGVPFPLATATDEANDQLPRRVTDKVAAELRGGARVAVLGMSYKPATPVVERSQGVDIARELVQRGFDVVVHDPMALEGARDALGELVEYACSPQECVEGAHAVVIATPWPEYRELPVEKLDPRGPRLLYDCWDVTREPGSPAIHRRVLGRNDPTART